MGPAAVPVEAAGVLAEEVFPAACAAEFAEAGRCQASPAPMVMAECQTGYQASAQATPALSGLLPQFSEVVFANDATACGTVLDE